MGFIYHINWCRISSINRMSDFFFTKLLHLLAEASYLATVRGRAVDDRKNLRRSGLSWLVCNDMGWYKMNMVMDMNPNMTIITCLYQFIHCKWSIMVYMTCLYDFGSSIRVSLFRPSPFHQTAIRGSGKMKCWNSWNPKNFKFNQFTSLVGGWTNPLEKYAHQNGFIFPRDRGENKKTFETTSLHQFI